MNGNADTTAVDGHSPRTLKKRRPGSVSETPSSSTTFQDAPVVGVKAANGPASLKTVKKKRSRAHSMHARGLPPLPAFIRYEVPRKLLHSSIGFLCLYLYCTHQDCYTLVKWLSRVLVLITTVDVVRFASDSFEQAYEKLVGFLMREKEKARWTTWNGVIWYLVGVIFVLVTLPRDLAVLSICLLSWADTTASVVGRKLGKYTPKLPSPPFADRKSVAGSLGAFLVGGLSAWMFFTYAAPLGAENDLTWLGPSGSLAASYSNLGWLPASLSRVLQGSHIGKSTGFPKHFSFKFLGTPVTIPVKLPQPKSTLPLWQIEFITALAVALAEGVDIYGLDDNLTLPVAAGLLIWAALYFLG